MRASFYTRNRSLTQAAVIAVTLALVSACTRQSGVAAPLGTQSVILISIDGYRADFLDQYDAPHLRALAASGVRARWLRPSTPTLTFPNHYTLVTGLYPAHHGIVGNRFRDPAGGLFVYTDSIAARTSHWWGGEPVWVTAERQGMRSGAFFWVGSEASIRNVRPTFWKKYDEDVSGAARVDTILSWMTRPDSLRVRLALLYFSAVDHAAHDSSPESPTVAAAILGVDSAIGRLVGGLRDAGLWDHVNIVVVSDHGMAANSRERVITLDDYLDPTSLDPTNMAAFVSLRPRDGNVAAALAALRRVPHLTVYPRDSVPARWHYAGNPRIEPIVGVLDDGWLVGTRASFARRPPRVNGGDHGFDQDSPLMRATFLASGPSFRRALVVEPFANIHVYELLCAILGLRPAPNDGSLDSVRTLMR